MKIKFITPCCPGRKIFINPSYFFIKSYYLIKSKYSDLVSWTDVIYDPKISVEEMIEIVIAEKIDILCLGMYVWNKNKLMHLARTLKQLNPDIIIIAGGPDLDANKNTNFFKSFPYLDYVVYGDGEEAFTTIMESIITKTEISNGYNIVTDKKVYPHKIFQDAEFSLLSPWIMLGHELKKIINYFGKDNVVIYWEVARGCPYVCSFCDWNNGLHTKVKRRKVNWKEEIDFFAELGAEVKIIDANWGIYKEDLEIHKYALSKLNFVADSLTKLNKKMAYEIMSLTYQHNPTGRFIVALQDLNEHVLENIDRPSIPWDEHKTFITEIKNKHPNLPLAAELISGLPGQTVDSWVETLCELESAGIKAAEASLWMILPGSPGAKSEYQSKFSIKTQELILIQKEFESYDAINQAVSLGLPNWYKSNMVIENYSSQFHVILTNYSMTVIYNILHKKFNKIKNFKSLITRLKNIIEKDCIEFANLILTNKILGVPINSKIVPFENYYFQKDIKEILKCH